MHQTVHPDGGPGPMDRPRQGDSLAGNMAGQIIGIACGSVENPLKDHERKGRTQQHESMVINGLTFKPCGTTRGVIAIL